MARVARWLIPALLLLGGVTLLGYYVFMQAAQTPTPTPLAVVPTETTSIAMPPTPRATVTATQRATATETATTAPPLPTVTTTPLPEIPPTVPAEAFEVSYEQRFGLTGFGEDVQAAPEHSVRQLCRLERTRRSAAPGRCRLLANDSLARRTRAHALRRYRPRSGREFRGDVAHRK